MSQLHLPESRLRLQGAAVRQLTSRGSFSLLPFTSESMFLVAEHSSAQDQLLHACLSSAERPFHLLLFEEIDRCF